MNTLSTIQSTALKKKLPGVITYTTNITVTSVAPYNPSVYIPVTSVTRDTSNVPVYLTSNVTTQTGNYLFTNGTYICSNSGNATGTSNTYGDLNFIFYGSILSNIWLSSSRYDNAGSYTGTNSTISSSVTINGEWISCMLPYKLFLTTYEVCTGAAGAGTTWNTWGVTSFTLCGSNNGTSWTTLDSRSGVTYPTNGVKSYIPTVIPTIGYSYYRLIGTSVGALTSGVGNKMGVCMGLGGIYHGVV